MKIRCALKWFILTQRMQNLEFVNLKCVTYNTAHSGSAPPGGYGNYFLMGCVTQGLKPLPISKDVSPTMADDCFFEIFANRGSILRGFQPKKQLILQFFCNFCETGPSSKDFLTKMGPMSKDFWWKSNPFVRHIPVCLNMWGPPPPALPLKLGGISS